MLVDKNEEKGERFWFDLKTMEKRYQVRCDKHMMTGVFRAVNWTVSVSARWGDVPNGLCTTSPAYNNVTVFAKSPYHKLSQRERRLSIGDTVPSPGKTRGTTWMVSGPPWKIY